MTDLVALMPFAQQLGITITSASKDEVVGHLDHAATVFVRGVRGGAVTATAHPVHVGRSSIVVTTELRDDQGRLVSQTTQTQAVLPGAAS
jgi:uncharacterized protein (TIGR00369 family)